MFCSEFVPSRIVPEENSQSTLSLVRVLNRHERKPSPRSGHACVADAANLYLYGGFCNHAGPNNSLSMIYPELWVYNFSTCRWTLIESRDVPDTGASAALRLWNRKLYLYGGTGYPFGLKMSNALYICHIDDGFRWEKIRVSNSSDGPREAYGQGVTCYRGDMYVFGGAVGLNLDPINDLHRLSFEKSGIHCWQQLHGTIEHQELHGRYKTEIIVDPACDRYARC